MLSTKLRYGFGELFLEGLVEALLFDSLGGSLETEVHCHASTTFEESHFMPCSIWAVYKLVIRHISLTPDAINLNVVAHGASAPPTVVENHYETTIARYFCSLLEFSFIYNKIIPIKNCVYSIKSAVLVQTYSDTVLTRHNSVFQSKASFWIN